MRIHGLTVCVDYADLLAQSIGLWLPSLTSLTVVTTERDEASKLLALTRGALLHVTDAFYRNGAAFNKGAAMEEARRSMPWSDWILFFDADIVPPADWLAQVEAANPQAGKLYGARRMMDDGTIKRESGEIAGFFMLFHSTDPRAAEGVPCDWRHAGGYDSDFQLRWGADRVWTPLTVRHVGAAGRNWYGRGNAGAMDALIAKRRRGDRTGEKI